MPMERGNAMINISFHGRDLLRKLAWYRHKPMYAVLEEVLQEALDREVQRTALAQGQQDYGDYVETMRYATAREESQDDTTRP